MSKIIYNLALLLLSGPLVTSAVAEEPPRPEDPKEVLLYPVQENGEAKYINREGKVVIPGPFHWGSRPFREGLAVVSRHRGKIGYINEKGEMVIAPRFAHASDFSDGMARVSYDTKSWGYIDRTGRMVIEPRLGPQLTFFPFSEGLAVSRVDNSFGFIDRTGKVVIERKFTCAKDFSEGLAVVLVGDKYGYIDRNGRMVIKSKYYDADSFSEGLAKVRTGLIHKPRVFFINPSGEALFGFDIRVRNAGSFHEGLATIEYWDAEHRFINRKVGVIDKKGNVVIEPTFETIFPFSDGLAAARKGTEDKLGYIDRKGRFVIEMKFKMAFPFSNGVAMVRVGGETPFGSETAYIDKKGNYIWAPTKDKPDRQNK